MGRAYQGMAGTTGSGCRAVANLREAMQDAVGAERETRPSRLGNGELANAIFQS